MPSPNNTDFRPSVFILASMPGQEVSRFWTAFPLCSMYIVVIVGNCAVLFIVKMERSLHAPMYFFLCMLAALDLMLSTCTVPRLLSLLWSDLREISFGACLIQMFFIHSLSAMESSVLLAMALDRYLAICHPLRHAAILTNPVTAKIGLAAVARGVLFFLPVPLLILRLPFCGSNILSHSYCLHQDVMNLACASTKANMVYGLTAILLVMGLDSLLISLSYFMIIKAVLQLSSRKERLQAFSTCVAHLCVVLAFYVPLIGLSVVHRFGKGLAPLVHVVMGYFYLLVPPLVNPIVYGVRIKQIRSRILRWCSKALWPSLELGPKGKLQPPVWADLGPACRIPQEKRHGARTGEASIKGQPSSSVKGNLPLETGVSSPRLRSRPDPGPAAVRSNGPTDWSLQGPSEWIGPVGPSDFETSPDLEELPNVRDPEERTKPGVLEDSLGPCGLEELPSSDNPEEFPDLLLVDGEGLVRIPLAIYPRDPEGDTWMQVPGDWVGGCSPGTAD